MLPWLRSITPDWVGLDINPDEIRLLQLKQTRASYAVRQFAVQALPAGALSDGKICRPDVVRTALQALVQKTQTAGCPTAIALPANTVISQQIKLAACLSEQECETEISTNLTRYVPGVNDALCFDFATTATQAGDYQEVRLVASRLEQLRSFADVVMVSGLNVQVVDVDTYAMMRATKLSLEHVNPNTIVACVDVSNTAAQFMVFHYDTIIFSQHWHISDLSKLPAAIHGALQLYLTAQKHLRIEHVLLSGKIAPLTAILQAYFQEQLALVAQLANPFRAMSLPVASADELQQLSPRFQVCCGLIMRRVQHAGN